MPYWGCYWCIRCSKSILHLLCPCWLRYVFLCVPTCFGFQYTRPVCRMSYCFSCMLCLCISPSACMSDLLHGCLLLQALPQALLPLYALQMCYACSYRSCTVFITKKRCIRNGYFLKRILQLSFLPLWLLPCLLFPSFFTGR